MDSTNSKAPCCMHSPIRFLLTTKHFVSSNRPIAYRLVFFVGCSCSSLYISWIHNGGSRPELSARLAKVPESAKRPLPRAWKGEWAALAVGVSRTTPGMKNEMAEVDALWEVYQEHPAIGGLPSFPHVGTCCSKIAFEKDKASKNNPENRLIFILENFPPRGSVDSFAPSTPGATILQR